MSDAEKRQHKRIPLKMAVLCQKAGLMEGRLYTGNTVDVCPGGVLLEINGADLKEGELVNLELAIPPTRGLLEYGGRFATYARVLRVERIQRDHDSAIPEESSHIQRIAMEFCEVPRLRV
jgi:hypothetical protein